MRCKFMQKIKFKSDTFFFIHIFSSSNELIGVDEDSVLCRKMLINKIPLLANV